jgi:hypothetical protein
MAINLTDQFRAFDVWKRKGSDEVIRYRCFENLSTGMFCVQSADFYQSPVSVDRISQLEKQLIELLLEQSPIKRSGSFATIEEAIADHDKSFE